jgi:hypothetical protein
MANCKRRNPEGTTNNEKTEGQVGKDKRLYAEQVRAATGTTQDEATRKINKKKGAPSSKVVVVLPGLVME